MKIQRTDIQPLTQCDTATAKLRDTPNGTLRERSPEKKPPKLL